jgi:hypothetical protein
MRSATLVLMLGLIGAEARGGIHFHQPTVDIGEVKSGVPLTHRFAFVIDGPEPVEILEARASCGCMVPRLEKRVFQPGESSVLTVEVNTLNQSGGPQTYRIQVFCQPTASGVASAPRGPTLEIPLQLTARIVTEITVRPAALTIFAKNGIGHEIVLTDLRVRPLSIIEVRTSSPNLKSQVTETLTDEAGHQARKIHLEVTGDFPEGRHDETLAIYTDDPTYREVKVPVTIIKQPNQRLVTMPSQVELLAPPGQPIPSRIVLVRDQENQEVVIEKVDTDHPAIQCRWAQGPGVMATVKITADQARLMSRSVQATVRIHLSKPYNATITVPLTCMVQ